MEAAIKYSEAALDAFRDQPDILWLTLFQPIPKLFAELGQQRGGNILGLEQAPGNSICE